MFRRLSQGEKGFTLIELLASMVILSMVIGVTSQVFNTGLNITNKTAAQSDLRRVSRSILTKMEKDIQQSYQAQVLPPDSFGNKTLNLLQYNGSGLYVTKTYKYNANPINTISVSANGGAPVTLATDVTAASFGDSIGQTTTKVLRNVPLSLTLGTQKVSLNSSTDAAPRWNAGPDSPYIKSVDPGAMSITESDLNLTGVGSSVYVIPTTDTGNATLAITGVNTNWDTSSVVTLKMGNVVYATSDVNSPAVMSVYGSVQNHLAVTSSGKTQVLKVTLYTLDGKALPFGYYDLYVTTSNTDVWAPSIFSSQWDSSCWSTTQGQSIGLWAADFPFVTKLNKNDSGKPDYFVAKQEINPSVEVGIYADPSEVAHYSFGSSNPTVPDAEIALWAQNTGGAQDNSYIGVGINSKYVIIRQVTSTSTNNNKITLNATVLQQIPISTINTTLQNFTGTVILGVSATNINGIGSIKVSLDTVDASGHTYTVVPTSGTYLGVVVPNDNLTTVQFSIMRL